MYRQETLRIIARRERVLQEAPGVGEIILVEFCREMIASCFHELKGFATTVYKLIVEHRFKHIAGTEAKIHLNRDYA